ncbi:MAG: UDP-N-acetylmuramoyl-L-alanyl-D-glutamate--2,6-diaminopimelate ligase [Actinomycetota bacterium]|nr:UDP-N-acetylmuramoyl-L-alanyl-D-glutamate--2,6-diaminopimelate ligase [Actinomycetota bacterium]
MDLKEIIKNLDYIKIYGGINKDISSITFDSRNVVQGSLFVAIPGFKKDGRDFIKDAIGNGAIAVISSREIEEVPGITQILVNQPRKALASISNVFYGRPSDKLKITGITGTNGKTTTTFLLDSMLKNAGLNTSFITTIKSEILNNPVKFDRTTPESLDLNIFFKSSTERSVSHTSMEISSHAVDLHRIDFMSFETFVFTNLTQDHLDYHETIENYFNTKKKLFMKEYRDIFKCNNAIINIDDFYGRILYEQTDLETITYSAKTKDADLYAENIICDTAGIHMNILFKGKGFTDISSPLSGYFNVYNILAATGAAISLGLNVKNIKEGAESDNEICGRFEKISEINDFTVIIDYAHTPDGLANVLKTAKSLLKNNARLISVFGCGGDRDKSKRSKMGKIAGEISDYIFITSDNPRSEEPESIIAMIEEGVRDTGNINYLKLPDREKAIINALKMAKKNDIVVIAGKGHEDYQEFSGYRIHFSDQEIVKQWNMDRGDK